MPIRKCYIQSETGNAVLQTIRLTPDLEQILIKTNRRGEALVVLNGKAEGKGYLEEEILGIPVRISPTSFFQVNLPQAEAMYQHAYLASGLQKGEMALDAYCGVGVFAAYLCRQGVGVVGIEVVDAAVRDAKKNAPNATFLLGAVEDRMDEVGDVDVIFLNPPRKGCEESVMEACLKKGPRTIIYTSCDPATLARDLQRLKGYGRVEAQPFDMFPQTMHVEIVAKISKIY